MIFFSNLINGRYYLYTSLCFSYISILFLELNLNILFWKRVERGIENNNNLCLCVALFLHWVTCAGGATHHLITIWLWKLTTFDLSISFALRWSSRHHHRSCFPFIFIFISFLHRVINLCVMCCAIQCEKFSIFLLLFLWQFFSVLLFFIHFLSCCRERFIAFDSA